MNKLAIVIPAFKIRFLSQTLDSIARQSCKDFTLYIGDDNSPDDIYSVVREYEDVIDIVYKKFPENLGSKDLLSHWERCIDMAVEPYIFFFSDDDIMPFDIVSRFYDTLSKYPQKEFFRIQLAVVSERNELISTNSCLKDTVTAEEMLCDKLFGKMNSAACEFIFSANLYHKIKGFVHFPLAWCSDDATFFKMAQEADGAIAIHGYPVLWRNAEGVNISNDKSYNKEKVTATLMFIRWLRENYSYRKDRYFKQSLYRYIRCLLRETLQWNYSNKDLFSLCKSIYCITPKYSVKLFFKYLRFHRHKAI